MNRRQRRAAAATWEDPKRRELLEKGRKFKAKGTYLSKAAREALNELRKDFPDMKRRDMKDLIIRPKPDDAHPEAYDCDGNLLSLTPAPDIHQYGALNIVIAGQETQAVERVVSYMKSKNPPNTGRWYRVQRLGDGYAGPLRPGNAVLANLTMRHHVLDVFGAKHSLYSADKIALRLKANMEAKTMTFEPLEGWVVTMPNDEKHTAILRRDPRAGIIMPNSALNLGQRTDEVAEDPNDPDAPEREHDGVRAMFGEVMAVPEGSKFEVGDMLSFKGIAAVEFTFLGQTFHAVPCAGNHNAVLGRVRRSWFEAEFPYDASKSFVGVDSGRYASTLAEAKPNPSGPFADHADDKCPNPQCGLPVFECADYGCAVMGSDPDAVPPTERATN